MTTERILTQEEKMQRGISRIVAQIVLEHNASNEEIMSGLYKPISDTGKLIKKRIIRNAKKHEDANIDQLK